MGAPLPRDDPPRSAGLQLRRLPARSSRRLESHPAGDLAADIADAETAIRDLNQAGTTHVSLEGLARFLLRAESVASSKIEGLDAGARRLVEAEALLAEGGEAADRVAVEVLGNIASMESADRTGRPKHGRSRSPTCWGSIEILMERSPTPRLGGVIREEQNWIGGSSYNPCSATFVPPPAEHVQGLLEDLTIYINGDEHPALVQAAIAHAQFETIHPFADGNGRTGRALIHIILRRRGLAPAFVPPISLVLATWSSDYISGLTALRHLQPADSPERSTAAHVWLRTFAGATLRACNDAESLRLADRRPRRPMAGAPSAPSARGQPWISSSTSSPAFRSLTVDSAARLIDRSDVAAGSAVNRLAEAGILTQRNIGKQRYRIFEAPEVLELFTSLERALASPTGDTATDAPIRPVPQPQR